MTVTWTRWRILGDEVQIHGEGLQHVLQVHQRDIDSSIRHRHHYQRRGLRSRLSHWQVGHSCKIPQKGKMTTTTSRMGRRLRGRWSLEFSQSFFCSSSRASSSIELTSSNTSRATFGIRFMPTTTPRQSECRTSGSPRVIFRPDEENVNLQRVF